MILETKPRDIDDILDTDNVAELYDKNELSTIATYLSYGYKTDVRTMKPYKQRAEKAIKIARMDTGGKDKTFPFVGASNVMLPYLAEAALEFNSRIMEVFKTTKMTKVEVIGKDRGGEKERRGRRVKTAIDYVINHELDDKKTGQWRADTDRATLNWAVTGMFFRKNWHCPLTDKQRSALIFSTEMVYDHSADSFSVAPRKSFPVSYSKNETITKMRSGEWVYVDLPEEPDSAGGGESDDSRYDSSLPPESGEDYEFIEMHCELDLDGDQYAEPYIVTMYKGEEYKITSIVKRFDEEDITFNENDEIVVIEGEEFFTQYGFIPDIAAESKAVFVGWGIMLYDALESINTLSNQMIDAGTLQNTAQNSGFIDKSIMRQGASATKKGKVEMIMGQFTQIMTGGSSRPLKDSIVQFPFTGPSEQLFKLLEALKMDLRRMVAASANLEANANEAAELYLARMMQALKVPNALGTRLYDGVTQEMQRISYLIHRYSDNEWYNDVLDDEDQPDGQPPEQYMIEVDFDDERIAISPSADPRMGSELERIQKATIVKDEAKEQRLPIIDIRTAYVKWLEAIQVDDIDQYIPPPDPKQGAQADMLQQLQMAYAKADMETQANDSKAKMLTAQARMLDSVNKSKEVEAEIRKTISETLKNLSEVESKQLQDKLAVMDREFAALNDFTNGVIDGAERAREQNANNTANTTVVN